MLVVCHVPQCPEHKSIVMYISPRILEAVFSHNAAARDCSKNTRLFKYLKHVTASTWIPCPFNRLLHGATAGALSAWGNTLWALLPDVLISALQWHMLATLNCRAKVHSFTLPLCDAYSADASLASCCYTQAQSLDDMNPSVNEPNLGGTIEVISLPRVVLSILYALVQVLGYHDMPKEDASRPADFFDTPPDKDITVCCIVGIKDPVRKEVPGTALISNSCKFRIICSALPVHV